MNIVAIVGRPNVEINPFNRLIQERAVWIQFRELPEDNYGKSEWNGKEFSGLMGGCSWI
jgi:predicted GTPase